MNGRGGGVRRHCAALICLAMVVFTGAFAQGPDRGEERRATPLLPEEEKAFAVAQRQIAAPPFDVIGYTLELNAAMVNENFGGRNLITMVLTSPADSVVLYQLKLQIDSVKVDGAAAPFSVSDTTERFVVRLGTTRAPGDTLRIDVAFRRLPEVSRRTDRLGYYYFSSQIGNPANLGYTMSEPREARCWIPCYDEPWEKATAAINVTVPAGYVAASNGRLLGVGDNGDGTVTWRWREDHQIATYLMCATISRWTNPTIMYARGENDTIPVQYFVWAKDSAVTANFLPTVRQMIANLSALFGPYPWDKYGMTSVTPFLYGGMEHQSITTLIDYYQTDQDVVVHELAHQWWGDLVTCATWSDIWLNESFASYSEALWHETLGGAPALRGYMVDSLEHFNYGSWSGAVYDPESQGFNLFASAVYSKGGWVLHTLRGVVGDSAFFRTLRKWRDLHGGGSATTADFQAVVESVVGKDMSWFFNEWIYGPGWPRYFLTHRWEADTLSIGIQQQQLSTWPIFTMPVQVRAYAPGKDTTFIVWDSLRTQEVRIPLSFPPDSVVLDPDRWILRQTGIPVSVEKGDDIPLRFVLEQNYPNPFNPSTAIRYQLSEASVVRLAVYDLLGREVETLRRGLMQPGVHEVLWDGTRHASGVYFCRLQAQPLDGTPPQTAVRKMALIK